VTYFEESGQACEVIDALVTINYSTKEPEELIAESLEPTAEFITLDYRRFRWGAANGDPVLEGEAPGKLLHGLNLVRTYYKIANPPAAILTLPGSVNNGAYNSSLLGLTFPVETLLFQPPQLSRKIDTEGAKKWDMTLKFTFKPEGWNKFWRAKTQQFERFWIVSTDGYGVDVGVQYNMYPLKDFSSLLS
jgi:hypothetical protein